jgi:hypothetical protein
LLKNSDCRLLKKVSEARRAKNRSFDFRSGQVPHQFPKIECWRGVNASLHYSTTPSFQSLVRWSEAIERNEAYEPFSAACWNIAGLEISSRKIN